MIEKTPYLPPSRTLTELSGLINASFNSEPGGAQAHQDQEKANFTVKGMADTFRINESNPPVPGRIYFVEDKKGAERFSGDNSEIAALTTPEFAGLFPHALVVENNPRLHFIQLLSIFDPGPGVEQIMRSVAASKAQNGADEGQAEIAASATVYPGAHVMPFAVIEEECVISPGAVIEPFAKIGKGSRVHSGAVIGHGCVLGEGCIVYSNSVVGGYGFGYHDSKEGRHKIPQIGNVVLNDFVEIGSLSNIDRATIESTEVGEHTKIDSLVQIGHNTRVGKYVYIAGQCGISGSVTIGDYSMIGGNAGISDHVNMGEKNQLIGYSALIEDSGPGERLLGIPAQSASKMWRIQAAMGQLPDLLKRVKKLEKDNESPESTN